MAFQGSLREFSATDILQLLATQKKSGCLTLENESERVLVFVVDGRIVSTRQPGMTADDPLVRFMLRAHKLSDEQHRGIATIQRESNRDLEDLLVNGRYFEAEALAPLIERQVLDDLMGAVQWTHGNYRFDTNVRWPNTPIANIGIEGAVIEAARRVDEQRRFDREYPDRNVILAVRDLPDNDESVGEAEDEVFGVIDGRRTIAEVIAGAPLTPYETCEALARMGDAGWIEVVGRREPDAPAPPPMTSLPPLDAVRESGRESTGARVGAILRALGMELIVGVVILAIGVGLRLGVQAIKPAPAAPGPSDPFVASQMRDLRFAIDLYKRDRGRYPGRLEDLVADRWIGRNQIHISGHPVSYRLDPSETSYTIVVLK